MNSAFSFEIMDPLLGNQKSDIPDAFDNSNYEQFYICYMKWNNHNKVYQILYLK